MKKKAIGILVCTLVITASTLFVVNAAADWDPADGHKMHWPQTPDLSNAGMDVDNYWVPLADDWKCSKSGPVTDIHFWGSFVDDVLPIGGAGTLTIKLTIHADIPAGQQTEWSMPGATLWSKTFETGQYTVREIANNVPQDWYDPASGLYVKDNHKKVFQYNFKINQDQAFTQTKDKIYWLEMKFSGGGAGTWNFGWKTTSINFRWNDDAVYLHPAMGWAPMHYPQGHEYQGTTLDLAFVITTTTSKIDFGDAPSPYPTKIANNGARHTIVQGVFLGKIIDNENDGQPSADALGDDKNPAMGLDDEDGVVFIKLVHPGKQATVKVTASKAGKLDAWVDFNKDGDWTDANENIFKNQAVGAGANTLNFNVPANTPLGVTYSRFRFSTAGNLGITGLAADGEVEDYRVFVVKEINNSKMHHPQLPDMDDTGMDVDMFWVPLADDFKCTNTGPITDIHFWGSFANDILPKAGPGSLTFKVCIHADIPADPQTPWSRPGELLWQKYFFPDTYNVTQVADNNPEDWYDPATNQWNNDNHLQIYQYDFNIDPREAFTQKEGTIYWLYIKDMVPTNPDYTFGWKTTEVDLRWNDDATYLDPQKGWQPLKYPQGHKYQGTTLDLAFIITGFKRVPDLVCEGRLSWSKVKPGSTVTGTFNVKNVGDPESLLNWKVDTYPSWGTWTFTPSNGTNLTPADGPVAVTVTVVAPNEQKKTFTGEIKIVNQDDNADNCTITISLATPKNKAMNIPFLNFIENYPNLFPILRYILGL